MENKQSFSVEITLSVTNLMKIMDLSGKLGLVLGTNPVWKDGYVTFSKGLVGDPLDISLSVVTGRWLIATGDQGMLNLPNDALELMAEMSRLVEGKGE